MNFVKENKDVRHQECYNKHRKDQDLINDEKLIKSIDELKVKYPENAHHLESIKNNRELKEDFYQEMNSLAQGRRCTNGQVNEKALADSLPEKYKSIIGLEKQFYYDSNNGCLTDHSDKKSKKYKGREDFLPYLKEKGKPKVGDKPKCMISSKSSTRERFKQDQHIAKHMKVYLVTDGVKGDITLSKVNDAEECGIKFVIPGYVENSAQKHWTEIRNRTLTVENMWDEIYNLLLN